MDEYLKPTKFIDTDHPSVAKFTVESLGSISGQREKAVRLYYAVRDGIRYDPYLFLLSEEGLRASTTLSNGRAWCVPKAILLAACCRAAGIPARLGFADVRNHLSTERMRKLMKTDVFLWHGYTSILLDGVWVKATPAFNRELCEKFRLRTLDWDGRSDAIYHPFDLDGKKHMEYLAYRGEFADLPYEKIIETFTREYASTMSWEEGADFDKDVEKETTR
jgi:transglutaminase-like putative cysteine protease